MEQTLFDYYELQPEDRSFWEYHQQNPHIYELFKKFSFDVISHGFSNFGAKGIIERIRWETYTNKRFEPLKINNNYAPGYARMFMRDHPDHSEFFRIRALKSERNKV